jgi:hypothetical protein
VVKRERFINNVRLLFLRMIEFRLERGNPDDLEGIATIYSIYKPHAGEPKILAGYASPKLEEVSLISGIGIEELREAGGNIEGSEGNWTYIQVELQHENALPEIGDRLFVGEYSTENRCSAQMLIGMQSYIHNYNEQQQNMSHEEKPVKRITRHNRVHKDNLGDYIVTNYINPMMEAKNNGDTTNLTSLIRDFERFSEGSEFMGVVQEVCENLLFGNPEGDYPNLSVELMVALNNKNYEQAAELRDNINQTLNLKKI